MNPAILLLMQNRKFNKKELQKGRRLVLIIGIVVLIISIPYVVLTWKISQIGSLILPAIGGFMIILGLKGSH